MNRIDQVTSHISSYRYTLPNSILTVQQRQQYEEHGFFIVPKLIPVSELERYRSRFLDIAEGRRKAEPTMLVMKDINTKDRNDLGGEYKLAKLQGTFRE